MGSKVALRMNTNPKLTMTQIQLHRGFKLWHGVKLTSAPIPASSSGEDGVEGVMGREQIPIDSLDVLLLLRSTFLWLSQSVRLS